MKTIKEEISTFDTPQYKRVMAACKERDAFPTQAWIPDKQKSKSTLLKQLKEFKNQLKKELFPKGVLPK